MNKSQKKLEKRSNATKTVSIRMPRELHHKILNQAKQQHRSVSGQCLFFIHKVLTPEKENLVQEK